ncbi:BREX protein BrxB domain-containing protein, partial [Arthrospira platensis SPKY1]|nr:BREX protein BrxB domain-containing protein [Arthrospira platensis SPKY1]
HIKVPWRDDAAALQRVIFCVYDEADELRLRARIDEFELATKEAGHEWHLFDLTETFADWLSAQRYAESYFNKPELISTVLPKYQKHIVTSFEKFLADKQADENAVVALQGVGSLFGLTKVKGIVDQLAPKVKGRLVVFFPGSYENNNYRLLDAYDGWGYLAVPITADKDH